MRYLFVRFLANLLANKKVDLEAIVKKGAKEKNVIKPEESLAVVDTISDDSLAPEEIAADRALLDALWKELDALDPEGRRICKLLSRHSERKAAALMGMNYCTFRRHWEKVKNLLVKKLSDFR